jgi:hypothetical protein
LYRKLLNSAQISGIAPSSLPAKDLEKYFELPLKKLMKRQTEIVVGAKVFVRQRL